MTADPSGTPAEVHGRTDAEDRLVFADEMLAGLQTRCGGNLPGVIAVPELRELASRTRHFKAPLAREIRAFDGERHISIWAETAPDRSGNGCLISLFNWRNIASDHEPETDDMHRNACDRATADAIVRLDPSQCVLYAVGEGRDLADMVEAMNAGKGRLWTEFVELENIEHRQPLHWRLLDGARCRVERKGRTFAVRLLPLGRSHPGEEGFELLLIADHPLPAQNDIQHLAQEVASRDGLSGELGPVLRQPISRIIANAETIRARLAGPLSDEYSHYAADIATAGQHLLALVDDLADLEVVEAEGFSTAPDLIDLVEVARQATGILGMRAREKQIDLIVPTDGTKQAATGEFRRVLQILLNLIGNAINYAPPGAKITVTVGEGKGTASVTVADNGPGMAESDAARVFDKFERLGRSGDGGSGLGLHISRRLARAMGGELLLDTSPGEGARFTLYLPVAA